MERMNSISPECNELKHRYDDCFHAWFTEQFLKGKSSAHDPCADLLKAYQTCVHKVIVEKGIKFDDVELEILNTDKDKSHSHPDGKAKN